MTLMNGNPISRSGSRRAIALAALVLLACLAVTACMAGWVWIDAIRQDTLRFGTLARGTWELVETRVEKYEQGLSDLAEWCGVVETPSLAEWGNRMERFDLALNYIGMIEVAYLVHVQGNLNERWAKRIPAHWRSEWVSQPGISELVLYVERPEPGLEIVPELWTGFAEDGEAIAAAYRSAAPKTTGAVPTATNLTKVINGFRMYVAAYGRDIETHMNEVLKSVPNTIDRRPAWRGNALMGEVFGTISAEPFLQSALAGTSTEVDFEWFAGTPSATNRLNHAGSPVYSLTPTYAQGLHTNLVVPWYGQKWTVSFYPTKAFYRHSERGRAWMVVGAGTALSVALALLVLVQGLGRAHAEELASELAESRELLQAASEDRARLSRELHDDTIQSLYAIGLTLGRTRKEAGNRIVVNERLLEAGNQLDRAITSLRQYLLADAHTEPREAPRSLSEALHELVQRWQLTRTADFRLQADPKTGSDLGPLTVSEVLLIAQEAVSNALRHGQARNVSLWLRTSGVRLRLEVADDGSGFNPRASERPGHGLANMRERTIGLGGEFWLDSHPGGPTTVIVEIPL